MVASLHPAEGKGRGQGSPFSGACFVFQIGQGHIGRWSQCGYSPSPQFPHCTPVSTIPSITETSNSIQDMPRWTKPKNHSFSGSSSVLSCSLSSLNLCGCGWGLGCRGWNSPQVQKVSERIFHVRIRTGAWGQCWPRVRSGRNLVLVSRWDRWRCPGSPSSPRRNWNEMNQEHHPPSAFLMLWSRGEDEEHIPSSEGVQCKAWRPPRAGPPCPRGEDSPVHNAHLPWGRSRGVTVWCCAPRVRCTGRRQVAEVSTDGAVTEGSLASHHCLQTQRKEVRGLVAPGGPTPESPPTPAPRAQTEREHLELSTEGQAPRDSGISEQGSFHRTGSLGQTHGLWSKETLREHVGLTRPRDYAGVTASVSYYQRVRTPTCRTRTWEGRAAAWACLCCGFSLEPGPSSGPHRPAWAQQWGLRAQSGLQNSEEWGTEWGPWAWLLLGSLRGTKRWVLGRPIVSCLEEWHRRDIDRKARNQEGKSPYALLLP